MTDTEPNRRPEPETAPADAHLEIEDRRRVWQSDDLLSGETEAIIVHRGQVYRLRCTKHDKLILYK